MKPITQETANNYIRLIHHLLQWIVGLYALQLALVAWLVLNH